MFGTLRTLLAINVVLLHVFNVPTLGNYSVSFFFMLSGFLMTLIMHKTYGYNLNGFKIFWINRILRLYPVYFAILILTVLFILVYPEVTRIKSIEIPDSLLGWFTNITMIYPNVIPHRIEPRLVSQSWALTNELFFYLLISFGISKTFKRTLLWVTLSIIYYILTYKFYDIASFRYSAIPAASLPFSLGALLYWFIYKFKIKFRSKYNFLAIVFFLILFYGNGIYAKMFGDISIYLNMGIVFFLILALFNFKCSNFFKIDKYIGYYSYPIYLIHFTVLILYSGLTDFGNIENWFKLESKAFPIYFILLFIMCFILVHFIDINIDHYKNRIKKAKL
jgi:peptidoglycan/LPS O-acetylase OafA/YrhL